MTDRARTLHDAADSLRTIADHATNHTDDWRAGVQYAATLLGHVADDIDTETTEETR